MASSWDGVTTMGTTKNLLYSPNYLTPSGPGAGPGANLMSAPQNVAGQTPQTALMQGKQLLAGGGPGSSLQVGPNGEVSTTLKGQDPFAARLAELSKYGAFSQTQNQGAGTSEPARVGGGTDIGGNEAAARAAAFARGKDQAALIAQKGLEGVQNMMAARGIGGSTIEGGGIMDVFTDATNTLGNLSREIAMADAARAGDIADRNYQGDIVQRGQDINYRTALENNAAQRNQSLISLINSVGAY